MLANGERAFDLLKKLAYVRVSGTEAETKAARSLMEEALSAGAERCWLEEFTVSDGDVGETSFEVTAPYRKKYEAAAYLRSESTPEDGAEYDFLYGENLLPANLIGAKGKAVLTNGYLRYSGYEKLMKAGAAAVISYSGTTLDREEESDLLIRKLREKLTEDCGFCVAVNLRAKDAMELVARKAERVRIRVKSERVERKSQNVCAEITGTTHPDEIVSFGAHYDSVLFSEGVYDNMSGSVILMEALRYFAEHRPERTLRFHWYGSEEQGLLGSKAWCETHKDELEKHALMINVDVAGSVLGRELAIVTGNDALGSYVDGMMNEMGLAVEVKKDIYSSDSIPFADNGVPAVNFMRAGAEGASYIHDRRDCMKNDFLSADSLAGTAEVVIAFAERAVNAKVFPVKREIPADIQEKIDKYLFRKK